MAVERGPIVYCAEWPDYEGGEVLGLLFDTGDAVNLEAGRIGLNELLGGVSDVDQFGGDVLVIEGKAKDIRRPSAGAKPVRLIPYYLWANRGIGQMTVWLSMREYAVGEVGPAGGYIFYVNPENEADGWRYLEAAPFNASEGAKWGCFRTAIEGARGEGLGMGRRNTMDMEAGCDVPGTAADLCVNFSLNGFRDWFLPSMGELKLMYLNLAVPGFCDFGGGDGEVADNLCYWTSTQRSADMAGHLDFADNGREHYDDKDYPRRVRAIRVY
jgi:hypothetical protein